MQNTAPADAISVVREPPSSVSAISKELMAMVKEAAPPMSMERRSRCGFSCRCSMNPAAAAMPTGMLIQKIQAQETLRMIRPPTTGPMTADTAQTLAR